MRKNVRRATTDGRSLEDGARVSVVRQKIVNDVIPRRAYQDYSLELDLRAPRYQQVAAGNNAGARPGEQRARARLVHRVIILAAGD